MALAAARAGLPPGAWLWLAIARTRAKPAVIVRCIVASLQEDSPRPVTGLLDSCPRAIPPHHCASRKADRGDRRQRPLHEGQTAIEPYFEPLLRHVWITRHPDQFHQETTNGDEHEVPGISSPRCAERTSAAARSFHPCRPPELRGSSRCASAARSARPSHGSDQVVPDPAAQEAAAAPLRPWPPMSARRCRNLQERLSSDLGADRGVSPLGSMPSPRTSERSPPTMSSRPLRPQTR